MKDLLSRMFVSRWGKIVLISLVAVLAYMLVSSLKRPAASYSSASAPKLGRVASSVDGISRDPAMEQGVVTSVAKGFQPFPSVVQEAEKKEVRPHVPPAAPNKLVLSFEPEGESVAVPVEKMPTAVLPPGLLIPCRLFNGIESSLPDTPLIAHVATDIRLNGKVVVPKGTEVHGTVRADDHRSRVMTGSGWQLVTPRGKVLKVNGMGLTREYDPKRDIYGSSDGFAGIRGVEVRQDQQASKRFFAATGLAAVSKLSQQKNQTLLGDQVIGSIGNSIFEGGASVADEYARMKLKEVEKNRPFIRVAAGTEFYLYTHQAVPTVASHETSQLSTTLREREKLMEQVKSRLRAHGESGASPIPQY